MINEYQLMFYTGAVTSASCLVIGWMRKLRHSVYRNENGSLYRNLTQKERDLCFELLDNCFYNVYHDNALATRQISYKEYNFIVDLLTNGIPLWCGGLYYIEKNTPNEIRNSYQTKQQKKQESKENKHAKCYYYTTSTGELYKTYSNGHNKRTESINEEEFLANAVQEEIDRYNKIMDETSIERSVN